MEESKWSGFHKKSCRRGANGGWSVLGRGMHSDKCTSGKCVFFLARVDCDGSDDCGVCDRLKLF